MENLIIYYPLILLLALLAILILAGFLSRLPLRRMSLFEKMITGQVSTGIDKNGRPTYRYK